MVIEDEDEPPKRDWNVEGEDLAFIRDEGLELLALFRRVSDPKKRRMILDLLRLFAGEQGGR